MKVYRFECGGPRLIGRADIPSDVGSVYEMPLFGAVTVIREQYAVGEVAPAPNSGEGAVPERALLLSIEQRPELLPGWQPLSS